MLCRGVRTELAQFVIPKWVEKSSASGPTARRIDFISAVYSWRSPASHAGSDCCQHAYTPFMYCIGVVAAFEWPKSQPADVFVVVFSNRTNSGNGAASAAAVSPAVTARSQTLIDW